MSSFAGKTPIASSIHSDRAIPPARSNTETSYPDYAPPSYEAVTAISAPSTVLRPESFAVIEDEEPCTEPIERNAKSTPLRDPLDPMPPCFSRNPLLNTPYEALSQPFAVHAEPGKKFLDDAFEIVGTNLLENHGVWDRDWDQLLQDIHTVARLTKGQRIAARVLPVTMYMGCTGFFVSRAIERGMKRKKAASVNALLDVWNERFFRPRREYPSFCNSTSLTWEQTWKLHSAVETGVFPALLGVTKPSVQPLIDRAYSLVEKGVVQLGRLLRAHSSK
ncbi:hypothetical protein BN14_09698 [Rhizoctonia solani AG-1 IB]|uniref:Uncharacterized protein n=1 Tax=Thanatephorus cucumeris (strain AG1-IB / isolate 7/3/14) TaxID=1108050 RepID=M5C986_THACB|nr:hypothetical protein BN14_09698 [Rhizoctonia solani AG-1 IB]